LGGGLGLEGYSRELRKLWAFGQDGGKGGRVLLYAIPEPEGFSATRLKQDAAPTTARTQRIPAALRGRANR